MTKRKPKTKPAYQPKTGERCSCRPGKRRDNCPECEGTGMRIDFRAIRERKAAACLPKAPQLSVSSTLLPELEYHEWRTADLLPAVEM